MTSVSQTLGSALTPSTTFYVHVGDLLLRHRLNLRNQPVSQPLFLSITTFQTKNQESLFVIRNTLLTLSLN